MTASVVPQPGASRPVPTPKLTATGGTRFVPKILDRRKSLWFLLIFTAICFEGLGRKYLGFIPGELFYFLKDIYLVAALALFRIDPQIIRVMRSMYRPFGPFLLLAVLWSGLQVFQTWQAAALPLGVLGFRAYWLWWLAPPVVANVLMVPWVRRRAIFTLAAVASVVAIFAVVQFGSPVDDITNRYTLIDGTEVVEAFSVGSTGRARVSSTFSFITGFSGFVVLVPALLMSIGLGESDRRVRLITTVAAMLAIASIPMSGSRAPFVAGLLLLALVAWYAGFLFTRIGRRVIFVGAVAIFAVIYFVPDSLQGVKDRFESGDTDSRFNAIYEVLPPVALATLKYPLLGLGTGMQQNFRGLFGVGWSEYESEGEVGRYLIELGIPGYLFFWIARFGLMIFLLKAARMFKRAGRRSAAGAAIAYAVLTFYGSLTFDHIWQSLYFVGFGFILQELVAIWPTAKRPPATVPVNPAPRTGR
jgi:hypothetical protein